MSEITRREAMKLAAGTGLATAVGGSAVADEHIPTANLGGGKEQEIQGYFTAAHGVTVDIGGGMVLMAAKSPYDMKVKAMLKGETIEYTEPTTKTVVMFPAEGYLYFTLCYAKTGVYMNIFYDDKKLKNFAKWCCVTCPATGMTACGPGVCVRCGSQTICC